MLVAVSCAAAVGIGEVVTRLFFHVRNVGPTFSVYDPVYGKRLKKNFHCVRTSAEFSMLFTTNSLGFRGPEPAAFPKGGILFLGDSFTSGYGVNDGEEFADIIRRDVEAEHRVPAVPVVNAGSGNAGNGYWLKFLLNEVPKLQPRLLVLGFCDNDFGDNHNDGLYELDSAGALREFPGPPRQEGARSAQVVLEAIPGLAESHLVGLARQAFSHEYSMPHAPTPEDDRLTYVLIDSVFATCKRQNLPVLFLVIDVEPDQLAGLRALANKYDIPLLRSPKKHERPDLFYKVDGHWNLHGHEYVASLLLPSIDSLLNTKSGH